MDNHLNRTLDAWEDRAYNPTWFAIDSDRSPSMISKSIGYRQGWGSLMRSDREIDGIALDTKGYICLLSPDLTRLGVVNSVSAMDLRILLELHVVLQLQKYATDGIYHMPKNFTPICVPNISPPPLTRDTIRT